MNAFFFSLITLIAFAILDTTASLNIALISTIILTAIEVIYTIITFGHLDGVSLFSIGLVALLVSLSYLKKNRMIFKLKPAILNASMGAYMLIFHAFNQPILLDIVKKYPEMIPSETLQILHTPAGQAMLNQLSFTLGIALIIHGLIVGYSGIKHNNFWWATINILGLIVAMILAGIFAI
jgi:intracellular septation protein A